MGKLITLNPQSIKFVDCSRPEMQALFGLPKSEYEHEHDSFQVGCLYTLEQPARDGFAIPNSIYELKGIINTYAGVEINSLIVRKVDGPDVMKYTVSKQDCEAFGIPYEPQLEILPQSLPWKRVCKEFNPFDFSSIQTSAYDGLIHHFVIEVDGIEHETSINCVYIKELDSLIDYCQFQNATQLTINTDIRDNDDNHTLFHKGEIIKNECKSSIVTVILSKGSLFIHVNSRYGINPSHYQGLNASDLITVALDSAYLVSYEKFIKRKNEVEEAHKAYLANNLRKAELRINLAYALANFDSLDRNFNNRRWKFNTII